MDRCALEKDQRNHKKRFTEIKPKKMNLMDLMRGRITLKEGVMSQNVAWSKVLQRATYIAFPTMLTEVSIAGLLA